MERFMELVNHEQTDRVIVANITGMYRVTVYRKGDAHLITYIQGTFDEAVERCLARLAGPPLVTDTGPSCDRCGAMMFRTGSCHTCPGCGNTTGCG